MPKSTPDRFAAPRLLCRVLCFVGAFLYASAFAAEGEKRNFDIPAGKAEHTLKVFSEQSGRGLVASSAVVTGVKTNAVRGEMEPSVALAQMLDGTDLVAVPDTTNGAFTVRRDVGPNDHGAAQMAEGGRPTDKTAAREAGDRTSAATGEVVQLSPFTVSGKAADRYRATDAISAVRIRSSLNDTGSSISVVTREFMDDVAPGRLFDATRFLAGVQEGRFYNFQDRVIIRGFENNNGRTVDNFFNDSGQNYEESLVERIEVSKGPNAILSPAGTPGGSVNVITKSPKFTSQNSLTATVGLYEAQKVTLDLTGPVEAMPRLAYRLIGTAQDSRREWASDARLRRKVISPQLTYQISPSTAITVKMMYNDSWLAREPLYVLDSSISGPDAAPKLDPVLQKESRNGLPAWSGLHFVDTTGDVLLTSTLNEHINLRVALHGRRSRENSNQATPVLPSLANRYDPSTGILTPDYIWSLDQATGNYVANFSRWFDFSSVVLDRNTADVNNTFTAGQTDLAADYKLGGISSQTVAGAALANQHTYDRRWRAPLTPFNLAAGQPVPVPEFTQFYQDNRGSNRNAQLYINQRFGFWNDRLLLTGGILHYWVKTKAHNAFTNAPTSVLDGGKDMGLASIVVKPLSNVSVYGSYSTNGTPSIVNNQALWAEGRQYEFGVKSEFFDQRLSLTAAYFEIKQTNVSVPNPNRLFDPSLPASILSDLEDHGVEFEATGSLTKNISILASFTQLKLRDALGRRVRAIADRTGALLVNYRVTDGALKGFSAGVSASYSGSKAGDLPAVNFTPLNVIAKRSFFVEPYTMWNFNAAYRWRRWTFHLYVDNVFDLDRITQAGGRAALGLAPAWGRNVRFSTTVEF